MSMMLRSISLLVLTTIMGPKFFVAMELEILLKKADDGRELVVEGKGIHRCWLYYWSLKRLKRMRVGWNGFFRFFFF